MIQWPDDQMTRWLDGSMQGSGNVVRKLMRLAETGQEGCYLRQRQDIVNLGRCHRAVGHCPCFGGCGILHNNESATLLDSKGAPGAILASACQDYAHNLASVSVGRRVEQEINRLPRVV